MAMPWPPPTHMVSRPTVLSLATRPLSRVAVIRAPVMPNGWPSAMAAVHVEPVDANAELAVRGNHLRRERLVDLDQFDVGDGHADSPHCLPGRLDGPRAHDFRRQRAHPGGSDPGERGDPEVACLAVAHHCDRGRG